MNTLTRHVEQLAKRLDDGGSDCPSDVFWHAARLMTAMAKVCEASALVDEYTPGFDQIDARLKLTEARRELDALVQKGTH